VIGSSGDRVIGKQNRPMVPQWLQINGPPDHRITRFLALLCHRMPLHAVSFGSRPLVRSRCSVAPIIQSENVTKLYRIGKVDVEALRGVSLSVEKGEFVSIVGPSGSGKSTLFYILGGLTRATSGRVLIDGADFAQLTDAQRTAMRKSKIGFVFQKFNLLPTLSARDNIEIAKMISGRNGGDRKFFEQVTEMLGVAGRLDHRPAEMSGGEQQRVALARALINQPAIVLADEPTGNLDSRNSDAVLNMLRQANRQFGQTVLMITHNPEAARIGDRIIHMRDGRIVTAAEDPQWAAPDVAKQ
jgi:putative ABC transport system ATP-binding protein